MLASSPWESVCRLAALCGSFLLSLTPDGTGSGGGSGGSDGGSFQINRVVFCLGPSEVVDVDILDGSLGGLGGPGAGPPIVS